MNKEITTVTFPLLTDTLTKLEELTGEKTRKDIMNAVIADYLDDNKVR